MALVVASPALADGGWSMPSLNPFAKKGGPPTSSRVSDRGGGWKVPQMWPSSGKTIVKKPAGPSTWQKMRSGTKSLVSKTADFLNPFDDAAAKKESDVQITGSNSYFSQAANGKAAEQKSSFTPSWWGGGEEEEEPKTVTDFLALPRPGF
jgi:hypothetical protein